MEKKNVKIFNYPWHIAHQRELFNIPGTEWSWLIQHRRGYSGFPRGDYFNDGGGEWVPHYEEGKYDFALLHLDQQCFEDGIRERGKGSLFDDVNSVVTDIPKVCIMHGTPFYPEMFPDIIKEEDYEARGYTKEQVGMSGELIDRFQKAMKGFHTVVFNSFRAKEQWSSNDKSDDAPKYVGIWHGMNPEEWYDRPKEPRVVTMISPAGLDEYYDRTFLRAVKEELEDRGILHCHITVDAQFKNWDEYRNFLGRSLIYFNPTKESCMPRSRAEAMLSGCAVLTAGGQDAEMFIDGENGLIVPRSPKFVCDVIEAMIFDYKKAVEMGQKGKQTAIEKFHIERFYSDWHKIIIDITGEDLTE